METFMYTFSINAGNPLLFTYRPPVSPVFQTTFNGVSFSWKLKFCGKTDENNDKFWVLLCADNGDRVVNIDARFQCVLIPTENRPIRWLSASMTFSLETKFEWGIQFSPVEFEGQIPKDVKIYTDNCFKILCKIYIPHQCFNQYLPNRDENVDFSNGQHFSLSKNLAQNLFDQAIGNQPSDGLCDVVFQCSDGKSFYSHKFVLAFSSKVFQAMFSHFKTTGSDSEQIIPIEDIDADTLTEILRFIYKKEIGPNVDNLLESCLYAAEKYDLAELSAKCVATLKFKLTQDNVLDYLELADKFSLESLKMGCFEILRLFDHVIDKAQVKTFLQNRINLYFGMCIFKRQQADSSLVM